jgi:hypothetical protein
MIRFHRERDPAALEQFATMVARRGAHRPESDYLARARVYWIRRGGRNVGGFCIANPPERALAVMPADCARAFHATVAAERLALERINEITCVWIQPTESLATRFVLWSRVIWESTRGGASYCAIYCRRPGLNAIYSQGRARLIYGSEPKLAGDTVEQPMLWLYSRKQMLRALALYLPGRIRSRRARRRSLAAAPAGGVTI